MKVSIYCSLILWYGHPVVISFAGMRTSCISNMNSCFLSRLRLSWNLSSRFCEQEKSCFDNRHSIVVFGFRSSSSTFQDPPRRRQFTNDRLSYLVTHIIPIFLSMQQLRNSRQAPPGPSLKTAIPRILLITSSDHGHRQKDPQPSIICRRQQSSVHFIKGYVAHIAGISLSALTPSGCFCFASGSTLPVRFPAKDPPACGSPAAYARKPA